MFLGYLQGLQLMRYWTFSYYNDGISNFSNRKKCQVFWKLQNIAIFGNENEKWWEGPLSLPSHETWGRWGNMGKRIVQTLSTIYSTNIIFPVFWIIRNASISKNLNEKWWGKY